MAEQSHDQKKPEDDNGGHKLVTKTLVDEARVNRDLIQLSRVDMAISISSKIKLAYNDYNSAWQQWNTANTSLFAASSSFGVLQNRYNAGNAKFCRIIQFASSLSTNPYQ